MTDSAAAPAPAGAPSPNDCLLTLSLPVALEEEVLDALLAHPGPVVLSGYACDLYDDALAGWHRTEIRTATHGGLPRTEILWRNHEPHAPADR